MSSIDIFRSQFSKSREPGEPAWLGGLRSDAFERFLERGFPTTQDEEWRFTNVSSLKESGFHLSQASPNGATAPLLERVGLGEWNRTELVFVNGRFVNELSSLGSLSSGAMVTSLATAVRTRGEELEALLGAGVEPTGEETAFHSLNRAFLSDGAYILIPKNVVLEEPIHLLFLTVGEQEPTVSHPHNLVVAEAGSQLVLVETYAGSDGAPYFTNAVTEIFSGEGAVVEHYKVQREGDRAFHIGSWTARQARSSSVSNHSLSFGGRLVRHDVRTILEGEGADCTLNGLYVVKDRQHVDHHTFIDHAKPHCTSRELYKGILDDFSTGVFNGRVLVRADAQKSDSRQSNRNLLLSDDALVQTNPQLEINADDVKCAHGATVGQLDAEALFYLRSRGIGLAEAREILTRGFISDVSDRIRLTALRDALNALLFQKQTTRAAMPAVEGAMS